MESFSLLVRTVIAIWLEAKPTRTKKELANVLGLSERQMYNVCSTGITSDPVALIETLGFDVKITAKPNPPLPAIFGAYDGRAIEMLSDASYITRKKR